MTRAQSYLNRYMASMSYPSRLAAAERDYETDEEQRRYVDGLIETERASLKRLEDNFAALQEQRRYFDTTALEALLQDADVAKGMRQRAAGAQAGELDAKLSQQLERAASQDSGAAVALADAALQRGRLTSTQQATAKGILSKTLDARTLEQLFARHPTASAAASGGVSAAENQAAALLGELAANADTAIVGGAEGAEEVARREATQAPKGSAFLNEQDAYEAALRSLEGGSISRADFESEEDFRLAQTVYLAAKEKGAYENQEQLFFDRSMLESKARLGNLRRRAEELAVPAGLSRQQQIDRMVKEREGYDMDKPLARYQKSPYYQVLLASEDIYNAGLSHAVEINDAPDGVVIRATNEVEQAVKDVIDQRGAGPLNVSQMERELRKLGRRGETEIEGDTLKAALAWAIAYNRALMEGVDSPEAAKAVLRQQKAAKEASKRAVETAEQAVAAVAEGEAQEAITSAKVTEVYVRGRALGASKEEAADKVAAPPPAPAPAPAPAPPAPTADEEERKRAALMAVPLSQLRKWAATGSATPLVAEILAEREGESARKVVTSNKDVPFVQRIIDPMKVGDRPNADGSRSSHLLGTAGSDGRTFVYPALQSKDGEWVENEDPTDALNTGNVVWFDDEAEAEAFAGGAWKGQEYKKEETVAERAARLLAETE